MVAKTLPLALTMAAIGALAAPPVTDSKIISARAAADDSLCCIPGCDSCLLNTLWNPGTVKCNVLPLVCCSCLVLSCSVCPSHYLPT